MISGNITMRFSDPGMIFSVDGGDFMYVCVHEELGDSVLTTHFELGATLGSVRHIRE